ncbi:MAG: hypothetical protein ACI9BV_003767 [Rhodothermales bacterium]|jgi:hypothetical protein
MYRIASLALLLTLTATGCTSVRPGASFEEINQIAQTKSATIHLQSGLMIPATGLRVTQDSTHWIDPGTHALRSAPTALVTDVSFPERKIGAKRGALVGAALLGTLLGAASASMVCDAGPSRGFDHPDGFYIGCRNPPDNPSAQKLINFALGLAFGGAIGALPGALVGSIKGGTATYPIQTPVEAN